MDPAMVRASTLARLRDRIDALELQVRGGRAKVAGGDFSPDPQPAICNLRPLLWPGAAAPRGVLHEVRAGEKDAPAALGFAVAVAARLSDKKGGLVFIERAQNQGALSGRGLAAFGVDPARALFVRTRTETDALWAAEEAARSPGVAVALLVLTGEAKRLTLTATRRLHLAAGKSGATPIVVRTQGPSETAASAAAARWRVEPRPSGAAPFNAKAPGPPRWRVTIEKALRRSADRRSFVVEWSYGRFVFADEAAADFSAGIPASFRRLSPAADGTSRGAARAS